MKIVKNKTIDYLSANFEEDETLWDADSTYNYADELRWGHWIYKYAGTDDTNTNVNPQENIDNKINVAWVKIRPTNYYAMLDGKTNTTTKVQENIQIEIDDVNYDTFSLLGLVAKTITIDLYSNDDETIVFNKIFNLQDESDVVDFYSYCFSEFVFKPSVYVQIPIYSDSKLIVNIDNGTEIAECGRLVFGRSMYIGDTGFNANLSLESYSSRVTDEFGNVDFVHRGAVNLDSYEVEVPTNKVPMLRRVAVEYDAKPLLFIMDESKDSNLENLLIFGYWQNFSMLIPNALKSTVSVTIKGLL